METFQKCYQRRQGRMGHRSIRKEKHLSPLDSTLKSCVDFPRSSVPRVRQCPHYPAVCHSDHHRPQTQAVLSLPVTPVPFADEFKLFKALTTSSDALILLEVFFFF